MKTFLSASIFIVSVIAAGCLTRQADGQKTIAPEKKAADERRPVIVELFTSEGCSSCPPADRALKFLAEQQPVAGAEIIPLAFHVDYWNNLGWKDRFSSAAYTRRQELYVERFGLDSSYTPEIVVDGQSEFIGSDTGRAAKVITDAVSKQKGTIRAELGVNSMNVSITKLPEHHPATVFLAVTEDGITSNIKSGENAGETFNHTSVVRSLTSLGLIERNGISFQIKGSLPEIADLKRENSRFVVFVQDNISRKIIAAAIATEVKQSN